MLACACGAQVSGRSGSGIHRAMRTGLGQSQYLLEEYFEGTGYDFYKGWTESGTSTIDEDYTGVVLQGSQSGHINLSSSTGASFSGGYVHPGGATPVHYAYFQLEVISFPSANNFRVFSISNTVDVAINSTSNLMVRPGVGIAVATVGVLEPNTKYHVWVSGSGNDVETPSAGTATVAFSTDGIRPTSGDNYAIDTDTGALSSHLNTQVVIGSLQVGADYEVIIDNILVDDIQIGDNP